jgi:hypothetical protein
MTDCKMCGKKDIGYGNNGKPLIDGKVCDICNNSVIMCRIMQLCREKEKKKEEKEIVAEAE